VNIGETVPDIALVTPARRPVRLSEYRGEAMVLVFMRHLG